MTCTIGTRQMSWDVPCTPHNSASPAGTLTATPTANGADEAGHAMAVDGCSRSRTGTDADRRGAHNLQARDHPGADPGLALLTPTLTRTVGAAGIDRTNGASTNRPISSASTSASSYPSGCLLLATAAVSTAVISVISATPSLGVAPFVSGPNRRCWGQYPYGILWYSSGSLQTAWSSSAAG
jgi:hypothetical protein